MSGHRPRAVCRIPLQRPSAPHAADALRWPPNTPPASKAWSIASQGRAAGDFLQWDLGKAPCVSILQSLKVTAFNTSVLDHVLLSQSLKEQDYVEHILVQCIHARKSWYGCFQCLGMDAAVRPFSRSCSLAGRVKTGEAIGATRWQRQQPAGHYHEETGSFKALMAATPTTAAVANRQVLYTEPNTEIIFYCSSCWRPLLDSDTMHHRRLHVRMQPACIFWVCEKGDVHAVRVEEN